jgi:hypothetical protein
MEKDLVVEEVEVEVLKVVLEVEDHLVVQKVQEHSVDHQIIIDRKYNDYLFVLFEYFSF